MRTWQAGLVVLTMAALVLPVQIQAQDLLPPQAQNTRWAGEGWETDFSRATVDFTEIVNVIGRDNIPAIDDPGFAPVGEVSDIPDREPVIALEIDGDARGYPLRIMMWHEIVNDTVGGVPVAVTYCPLCNTALVFRREIAGEPVTFGTSGKLRHSDLIMYDRKTQSWWQQFTGEGIVGVHAGDKLDAIPSLLMSFADFKTEHPDGQVLQPEASRLNVNGRNPYVRYDSTPIPFLFRGELPEDIEAMERVVIVQREEPVAVALSHLNANAPLTYKDHRFTWQAGQASALDTGTISEGRDIGSVTVTRDGEPVVFEITFAFAARAFYPDLEILQSLAE
ncbi:DUF3179 domain-containing protein [Cucumibacter marinus]|uniref:DUF3179 domain-containing protein n=1 Tax=Cucumibacter marinus TaxID=1121252 RepID=UPI000418A971|nr:DUF3179 domain-containing protein [Cucumibacter marinus]